MYHGRTLTSRISLKSVCHAILKYAFATSPWPLVISLEIHCCFEQQGMIADIMEDVFQDVLVSTQLTDSWRSGDPLPSPQDLKYRILLKVPRLLYRSDIT